MSSLSLDHHTRCARVRRYYSLHGHMMTRLLRTFPLVIACSGFFLTVLPDLSHAQSARDQEAQAEAAEAAQKAEAAKAAKRAAPPSAIPGAAEEDGEDEHGSGDIEPTAALFDAINRGSTPSAKESINRGADLNGRNILGQTPLEMSIDMNRNAITFLLLSMRGQNTRASTVSSVKETVASSGDQPDSGRKIKPEKSVAKPGKLPDQSGGKPQPSVGFLGFSGS